MDENEPLRPEEPDWLEEFQDLANKALGEGPSCEQIHPIVERWYEERLKHDPPASRPSVLQALSCLTTEILNDAPEAVVEAALQHVSEDALAGWIESVLMIGRAFEIGLRSGELDDL
ncbi:MAG: hypothetical protein GYB67_01210 [Chloroflexi bacterium]|nr:hypothetical protein [Chloroflexota bacterium]